MLGSSAGRQRVKVASCRTSCHSWKRMMQPLSCTLPQNSPRYLRKLLRSDQANSERSMQPNTVRTGRNYSRCPHRRAQGDVRGRLEKAARSVRRVHPTGYQHHTASGFDFASRTKIRPDRKTICSVWSLRAITRQKPVEILLEGNRIVYRNHEEA